MKLKRQNVPNFVIRVMGTGWPMMPACLLLCMFEMFYNTQYFFKVNELNITMKKTIYGYYEKESI